MKLTKCMCGGSLGDLVVEKDGVKMKAQKCGKCGETYIPGSEMLRYDMIKGKSSMVRKVRKSGDSMVVTVPKQIIEKFNVHDGDVIAFEPHGKEIKIKIVHAE
ncbi:MAG: hypothetical protein HYW27_01270 [Candidatus Aenigmarchaeota archaeon]|nr:hypothetical protein [Candidatus Aenigmarchaeota archaeon]